MIENDKGNGTGDLSSEDLTRFILRAIPAHIPQGEGVIDYVVAAMRRIILSGCVRQGDRLPSASDVAKHLSTYPQNIKHAYTQLKELGIVETRRSSGTYVVAVAPALRSRIADVVALGIRLDVPPPELRTLVIDELKRVEQNLRPRKGGR